MFRWPERKKKFWREEALTLRSRYRKMFITHLLQLVFCEMYAYGFEVVGIAFNLLLLWLDFVNYQTLYKLSCFLEVGLLYLSTLVAFTHIQRVVTAEHF